MLPEVVKADDFLVRQVLVGVLEAAEVRTVVELVVPVPNRGLGRHPLFVVAARLVDLLLVRLAQIFGAIDLGHRIPLHDGDELANTLALLFNLVVLHAQLGVSLVVKVDINELLAVQGRVIDEHLLPSLHL